MWRLEVYGVTGAPSGILTDLAIGWLNAWTYDYRDVNNGLRDSSLRLHNYADELLGKYTTELKEQVQKLRKELLTSTRENPFPSQENFEAVREFEAYMRKVEDIRTRITNAARPPKEFIYHSNQENIELLVNLNNIDKEIIKAISTVTPDTIGNVTDLLEKRAQVLREFKLAQ